MRIQKFVRQVSRRRTQQPDRNKVDFIQSFTEAYDILPKTEGEIDILDIPHNKENLKNLFRTLQNNGAGIGDPIAISKNPKEKGIKVHRQVADDFDLKSLGKKHGFSLTAGNGSRGGTGSKSMGFGFEGQIFKDIEEYIKNGESAEFTYPDFMKEFHTEVLGKHKEISVTLDGGKNTRRPLEFDTIGGLIGGKDLDIGSKVTDITVTGDGYPYYLSLKYGGTVTFFNAGVTKIFPPSDFESGKLKNRDAKALLKMLGINEKKFIDIFVNYDKKNAKKIVPKITEDVTRKANLRALLRLLLTGVGHGYWMVHKKGKNVDFYQMTRRQMMNSCKVQKVTVLYPQPGTAKRIDIEVLTPVYEFKINIRNKQGGLYPSHIMCDYKPRKQ
jgi:hypothetical protein